MRRTAKKHQRTQSIHVKVTPAEFKIIKDLAKETERSMSAQIRYLVRNAIALTMP